MAFRQTFGITGYNDVIKASLDTRIITSEDFDKKNINYKGKDYILHCDAAVRQTLGLTGEAYCLVSYQERNSGLYAMARLYRINGK
jgi:hypothetical protein